MGLSRSRMKEFMRKGQQVLEDLWPASITVGDLIIPGAGSQLRRNSGYERGGEVAEIEGTIRISKERMAHNLKIGDRLTYQERDGEPIELRVIETSADAVAWVVRVGSPEE